MTKAAPATDATDALASTLDEFAAAIDALREARTLDAWAPAKARSEELLDRAQNAVSRAQREVSSMDGRTRVEQQAERFEELARVARQVPQPISCEAQLMAIVATPISGGASAGYAQKEAEMQQVLAQLDHLESRALAQRLRIASPDDPFAAVLQRWTAERRGRVIAFLENSRRREAMRRESELRSHKK